MMKIIETAIDQAGESFIFSNGAPTIEKIPGHDFSNLFFTAESPPHLLATTVDLQRQSLNIKPGEIRFVRSVVHPTLPLYEEIKKEHDIQLEKLFYHSTTTVDYLVIQKGNLVLLVGDDKVELEAGDCIVQRGAAHAWHNYTNEPAIIVGVMVGASLPEQFKLVKTMYPSLDVMLEE